MAREYKKLSNIDEWFSMEHKEEPALIENILPAEPGEFSFVSGRTGIGKSLLVMHMAYCLANGVPFMGCKCKKVKVGYIAFEGGITNIKDRLRKIRPQYKSGKNLLFDVQSPLLLERHIDNFKEMVKGCRVVILDNLRQITSGNYLENKYVAIWLKIYQQFLMDLGAVGVLTHHIKKPPSDRSLLEPGDVYNLKGASEYVDASSSVLLLERKKQDRDPITKHFLPVDQNALMLYFAKHRIAGEILEPIELRRNYETASLDVVI